MNEREKNIHLWFEMWLTKQDLGIDNIFAEDVIYTESWGPKYNNRQIVKHWFQEWNTRGKVVAWEIKQFFHKGNQTIVEWYFKNEMNNGSIEEFDGISLVEWTKDNKIKSLKEFGCNLNNYNPYEHCDLLFQRVIFRFPLCFEGGIFFLPRGDRHGFHALRQMGMEIAVCRVP